MECTIVIPLYNGEKWIIEQLESIRKQTRIASRVIMYDDCSTDNTYQIVDSYIKSWKLSNWTLKRNKQNIGYRENFKNLVLSSKTEVTITADQDDIWYLNKIETIMKAFESNSDIELLGHGRDFFFDEEISEERKSNIESMILLQEKEKNLPQLSNISNLDWLYITNHRLAMRKNIIDEISKFPELISNVFDFDEIVGQISRSRNSFYYTNEVLMSNRQHDESTSAKIRSQKKSFEDIVEEAKSYYLLSKYGYEKPDRKLLILKYNIDLSVKYGRVRLNYLKSPSGINLMRYFSLIAIERNKKKKLKTLFNDIKIRRNERA